jgi:hypothetical protein
MRTLDAKGNNRGMFFDTEMLPFCGKPYRVKQRVNRLINERTGAMMTMKTPGVVLENVVCMGCFHPERIFCPRGVYPYRRESGSNGLRKISSSARRQMIRGEYLNPYPLGLWARPSRTVLRLGRRLCRFERPTSTRRDTYLVSSRGAHHLAEVRCLCV